MKQQESLQLTIKDTKILHKIIDLQACIIEGKTVKNILQENKHYFLEQSAADFITVYMHEHDSLKPEFILEKENLLSYLLNKYIFNKKNFKWEKFVANCTKLLTSGMKYAKFTERYPLFKGHLSKRESISFIGELQMKNGIIMPLLAFQNKEVIGYVCFIFQSDIDPDIEKVEQVKTMLGTILRPLYDKESHTLYQKCIRIDEDMNFLTHQEKKIVTEVLTGATYTDIAQALNISINTLKTHMKNIFNKSNVSSKIELFNKYYIRL